MASIDDRIREEQARGGAACQAALEATPELFRSFIMFLERNKNFGSRDNPRYATIKNPYMAVDGRVAWAQWEHREAGKKLSIKTEPITVPDGSCMLMQATIESELLGTFIDYASINLGGSGVDKTNPWENASTSAVGRALGMAGYGLYGSGIASADEVVDAQQRRSSPNMTSSATDRPASDRQKKLIRDLLDKHGLDEQKISARLAAVATASQASILIDQLRSEDTAPVAPDTGNNHAKAFDNNTDMSHGEFDRAAFIRRLYGYGQHVGMRSDEVDAFCHIMSGHSRSEWLRDEFVRYGGDGPQGLKNKELAAIRMICQERLADIMQERKIDHKEVTKARAALQLPETKDRAMTFQEMERLAGWMRNYGVDEPPESDLLGWQEPAGDETHEDAMPSDPFHCPIHDKNMKERTDKKTGEIFYSHARSRDGKWEYCAGDGFPSEKE